MTVARRDLVDPDKPARCHCISRCVRRAFLCGDDWDHRKQWLRDRTEQLAAIFAIDVASYAFLDNHFHTVLHVDPPRVATWSNMEVAIRGRRLHPWGFRDWVKDIIKRRDGAPVRRGQFPDEEAALHLVANDPDTVQMLRRRLGSLSWFKKCLKERIARDANLEDGCRGHFFEQRFKSIMLLDRAALLAAMAYVDLNPIRAGLATTPEDSNDTSVQHRIEIRQEAQRKQKRKNKSRRQRSKAAKHVTLATSLESGTWLAPIDSRLPRGLLNMTVDEYLTVVDRVGRIVRHNKRGSIPRDLPPILKRLDLDAVRFCDAMRHAGDLLGTVSGTYASQARELARRGRKRLRAVFDIGSRDGPGARAPGDSQS